MRKMLITIVSVIGIFVLLVYGWAQETEKKEEAEPCQKTEQEQSEESTAVELKEIEPFYYCAVEMTGSYDLHPTAFQTLYEEAGKQNLASAEIPFGIYYNDPENTPEEELKWELGLPVDVETLVAEKGDTCVAEEDKGALVEEFIKDPLKPKKWTATKLVSKIYDGPFDEEMNAAYGEIFEWIGQNDYKAAGPFMEKFLGMPTQNEAGVWCGKIEILVPVQKAEK
jgi:DNA gyrase inhibitor GyrI